MNRLEDSRRERKKRESRARIFKAARKYFNEKGFEDTSIDDISREADISKGTFFNYFPSKESLIEAIGEEEAMDLQYFVDVDLAHIKSPSEKIYKVMKFFIVDTISFEGLIGRIILYTTCNKGVKYCASDDMRKTIEQLVIKAQEVNEIKKDFNSFDVSMAIMGLYYSLILHGSSDSEKKIAISKEHFDKLFNMLYNGIATSQSLLKSKESLNN